jgi:hypothetical protein
MACHWEYSAAQRTRGEPAACEVARIPFPLCWLERGNHCYAVPCGHWCGLKRIALLFTFSRSNRCTVAIHDEFRKGEYRYAVARHMMLPVMRELITGLHVREGMAHPHDSS